MLLGDIISFCSLLGFRQLSHRWTNLYHIGQVFIPPSMQQSAHFLFAIYQIQLFNIGRYNIYININVEENLVLILPVDSGWFVDTGLLSGIGMHCTTQAQRLQCDKHLVPSGQSLSESHSLIWSSVPSSTKYKIQIELIFIFEGSNVFD